MVATGHPLAALAAQKQLQAGGSGCGCGDRCRRRNGGGRAHGHGSGWRIYRDAAASGAKTGFRYNGTGRAPMALTALAVQALPGQKIRASPFVRHHTRRSAGLGRFASALW